nr:hypothetical protein [uncultured Clostridium sp.]
MSDIQKGVTSEEILIAAKKMDEAGLLYSGNIILGLGGKKNSREHFKFYGIFKRKKYTYDI